MPQTAEHKAVHVHIISDSTSDIPPQMAKELNIDILHGRIMFGETIYKDGIDITPPQFMEMLKKPHLIPKTSQCTPAEYTEIFNAHPEPIISVNIAREFSGFITTGQAAAKELGRFDISFFDTGNASLGSGLLALAAARWEKEGFTALEIMAKLEDMKRRTTVFALADVLEYLRESGRISKAELNIGNALNIKPIIRLKDGETHRNAQVRTKSKGIATLIEKVLEHKPFEEIGVMQAGNEAGALHVAEELQPYVNKEIIVAELTPTVAAHLGPGIGVAVVEAPQL